MSSPKTNVAVLMWSSTILYSFLLPSYFVFVSSSIFSLANLNTSMSYTLVKLFSVINTLSTPNPVSTFLCSSGVYFPSFAKYSMNTSFQISTMQPQFSDGVQFVLLHSFTFTNISVSGPQGPSPLPSSHQLCSLLRKYMFSSFTPKLFHTSAL